MQKISLFKKVFKKEKLIIGALHFPPLKGYSEYPGFEYIKEKAIKDVDAMEKGGVDSIILENNYDTPHKIFVDSETSEEMLKLTKILRERTKLPLGISVLWNDYKSALKIAKKGGAQYIRVPVFVDDVETNYGKVYASPKEVTEYRKKIKADDILIFTDIQVKHSKMINKKDLLISAIQAIEAGSDGIIITGNWTGDPPSIKDVVKIRKGVSDFPILIGSGITDLNIKEFFDYVDAVIVGTFFKTGQYFTRKKEINIKKYTEIIDIRKVESIKAASLKNKLYF